MTDNLPQHLGFIMDGNRRWAKKNGKTSAEGHKAGYESFKRVSDWCLDRGLKVVTFWAFSSENWRRPKNEISALMKLLKYALRAEVERLHKKNVRFIALGRIDEFPKEIHEELQRLMEKTKDNTKAILNIGLNYGGREEIVDAIKAIIKKGTAAKEITQDFISSLMYVPQLPDPDFIIRTSGEQRSSGFLMWESAYSEWHYSQKLWPDFAEADLDQALDDFKNRKRNFGS